MDKGNSAPQFSPTSALLLILDLDETLVHATKQALDRPADFRLFDYHVYRRPFLLEFLQMVAPHFQLAVWSSASDDYVEAVVDQIFPPEIPLAFVWGRSRCTYRHRGHWDDPRSWNSAWSHYHYVKPLRKLKRKGYRLERILIVDDTPHKAKDNYGNVIYPREYLGAEEDRELLDLAQYLLQLKAEKNVRTIEKRGWWKQF